MNNREFKIQLREKLKNRGVWTKEVSNIEIRTRCPFCGDSRKDLNTGHFYIRINPDDNFPIVYNCFKCPVYGVLRTEDLEILGIHDLDTKSNLNILNKTSDKVSGINNKEVEYREFNYIIPEICNRYKVEYVEKRLGLKFNDDDIYNMKIIGSLKDFLITNKINKVNCKPTFARLLNNDYIGFLSKNNSYILFRDITDRHNIVWYKYPISESSIGQKVFYSMKSNIDLYTKDNIIINLSEGVLDAVSIAYNLNQIKENTLNIAICGKFYVKMVKHLISTGFIGSNIHINIYVDNDRTIDTSVSFLSNQLINYTYLLGSITLHYNTLEKDCGYPKDKIKIKSYPIIER